MKQHLILALAATITLPALATRALPQLRVTAVAEKSNAAINIESGALAALGGSRDLNAIYATTRDFKGEALKAYVVFDDSVKAETIEELLGFQGKIAGTLQCRRIRMGSSPDLPQVKTAVLAEQCTIKQLNQ